MTTPRTQNITSAFRKCVQTDAWSFWEGMDWYAIRRTECQILDPENPVKAAAIIAVLSPMQNWDVNLRMAKLVYSGESARGLGANVAKADAIMAGAIPESVVKGPKVTSFWQNIAYPNDATPVTVDRHAIDIACGKVLSDDERAFTIRGKDGYAKVATMYRRAAEILSKEYGREILPQQVQAVTWIYWRKNVAAPVKAEKRKRRAKV